MEEGGPDKLFLYQESRGTNQFQQVGKAKDFGGFWAGYFSTIYLARLSLHDRKWKILFFRQGSGDCQPYDIRIFSAGPSGLKTVKTFVIYTGAWVRGPTAKHGMLVMLGPIWHNDWQDLYEWNGNRFRFANRRFPNYFEISEDTPYHEDTDAPPEYKVWMTRAAQFGIHGRFREAKTEWRKALKRCRLAIWRTRHGIDDPSYNGWSYGDTTENCIAILQRLGWLAHHQYNHSALYRPIQYPLDFAP